MCIKIKPALSIKSKFTAVPVYTYSKTQRTRHQHRSEIAIRKRACSTVAVCEYGRSKRAGVEWPIGIARGGGPADVGPPKGVEKIAQPF